MTWEGPGVRVPHRAPMEHHPSQEPHPPQPEGIAFRGRLLSLLGPTRTIEGEVQRTRVWTVVAIQGQEAEGEDEAVADFLRKAQQQLNEPTEDPSDFFLLHQSIIGFTIGVEKEHPIPHAFVDLVWVRDEYSGFGIGNLLTRQWYRLRKPLVLSNTATPPEKLITSIQASLSDSAKAPQLSPSEKKSDTIPEEIKTIAQRWQSWYQRHGWVPLCPPNKALLVYLQTTPPATRQTAEQRLRHLYCSPSHR